MKQVTGGKIAQAVKALLTREVCIECDHIPYRFTNIPLRKILNWLKNQINEVWEHSTPELDFKRLYV